MWANMRVKVVTFLIVYIVSATFFYPFFFLWALHGLAKGIGGLVGVGVSVIVAVIYAVRSYGGRPERRVGRLWLGLNKWYPVSHGYFPVNLLVWDGTKCSSVPSSAHVAALPPRYILAMHPHGPFPVSASIVMPQLARFGETLGNLFAPVRFAAASAIFALPLVRDMYLWLGAIEASRKTLAHALLKGHSLAILPGGEHEQLLVCPDESPFEDLVAPVDGLFRLSLDTRTPLIPVFSFGERRSYRSSSVGLRFRLGLVRKYRVGLPIAWGRHGAWFPFVPFAVPITIVIGKPIPLPPAPLSSPDAATGAVGSVVDDAAVVAAFRERYMAAVSELFEAHKGCCEVAKRKTLRWVPRLEKGQDEGQGGKKQ